MPELPYTYTDPNGDKLRISASTTTVWSRDVADEPVAGVWNPTGDDAVRTAEALLAAGGTEHRVVSEEWLTTVIKISREDAARSMRERATEEIQRAWPRLADKRPAAEKCADVMGGIRALPLLDDGDGEVAHSGCSHEASEQPSGQPSDHITLAVTDSPKMLRETLCFAASAVGLHPDQSRTQEHIARLGRLVDECGRHRPLGTDGKHGDLHTATCGCEDTDVHYDPPRNPTDPKAEPCGSVFTGATGIDYVCTQPSGHTTLHRNAGGTAAWNNTRVEAATLAALTRRVNDLEEALSEVTDLMAAYQADLAALGNRLDAAELTARERAQSGDAAHIAVTGGAFAEEDDH